MEMEWDLDNLAWFGSKTNESVVDASSAKTWFSASTDSIFKFTTTSSPPQAEALLGLKLGKRTYFENTSTTTGKKSKSSGQICCQVEGCTLDLSAAKEYHRKHSKCPKVIVGGRQRRFCQQCSRFHNLSEFDESKRSCRRRLSDHNARRRKPQRETIHFNFPRPSTPFYGI